METNEVTAVVGAPAHGAEPATFESAINVSVPLMALTWLTFALICFVLYKVAWKPILAALQSREDSIRKALDDAEKARRELAEVESRGRQVLGEAQAQSESMIRAARAATGWRGAAARMCLSSASATAMTPLRSAAAPTRRQHRAITSSSVQVSAHRR